MKLGSLFDGSGGFPLAGLINGITPVWASEIEPYPVSVTKHNFQDMKHLGDVTKINGAEIEPVDIITFGSPCQDLSVAGKQKGIHDGERSNLFFEAIRIIREMRSATANEFPRFAVWENVPGAFSSNKGDDFRCVLEAFCRVCDETAVVPMPPKRKWGGCGCIVGNGDYSVAYRVYDAQYWGVPQRRKRIYLIADFRSRRAGKILFDGQSLSGNTEPSIEAWEKFTGPAHGGCTGSYFSGGGTDATRKVKPQAPCELSSTKEQTLTCSFPIENHPADSRVTLNSANEPCQTMSARMGTGGGNVPMILQVLSPEHQQKPEASATIQDKPQPYAQE